MKTKTVAIIQARMASTRLPGKVLLPLAGDPALWWVTKRVSLSKAVDEIIIATTQAESNDPIREFCLSNMLNCYSYPGNENDLIGRVLAAAERQNDADIIIDVTSDCPMVDPNHIDKLIVKLKWALTPNLERYDYISNDIVDRSWPNGLDIQVYWARTLQKCKDLFNPEKHCGWNIAQHPEVFNVYHWEAPESMYFPDLGLTLDTPEDYELLKIVFDRFGHNPSFTAEGVVDFLSKNPELIKINQSVQRKSPEEG